jgi:hypothetical protein
VPPAKLQQKTAVESSLSYPVHPSGPPLPAHSIPRKLPNSSPEPRHACSKSQFHPGNAGLECGYWTMGGGLARKAMPSLRGLTT